MTNNSLNKDLNRNRIGLYDKECIAFYDFN